MKRSKLIISTVLCAYLILLGHLSVPSVNEILFENQLEHAHPGSGMCNDSHHHLDDNSSHSDFHNEKPHHCVYCCGHNKSLEFTLNDKSFNTNQLFLILLVVADYIDYGEIEKSEANQIYLQNVFKIPTSDYLISPKQFRAPPLV